MLSAETAAGKYPVETVAQMANIVQEAEHAEEVSLDADFTNKTFGRIDQSIAMGAPFTAYHLGCKAAQKAGLGDGYCASHIGCGGSSGCSGDSGGSGTGGGGRGGGGGGGGGG